MKALLVLYSALAAATAGSISWPGATVVSEPATAVKTVIPGQTKAFGYSTTQYINAVPGLHYFQPQVQYHVPQLSPVAPVQHTFVPAPGVTYYPSTVFYPTHPGLIPAGPIAPFPGQPIFPGQQIIPGQPIQPVQPGQPAPPSHDVPDSSQPAGDADTAIVDSADFPNQGEGDRKQMASTDAPQQDRPQESTPQSPPANPSYPTLPQIPQGTPGLPVFPSLPQFPPSFPQFPQEGGQAPQYPLFPQIPQGGQPSSFPGSQFPQIPQFPQFPQFPQAPSLSPSPSDPQTPSPSPPSSFPGADSGDKGLNDEDTISVDSA